MTLDPRAQGQGLAKEAMLGILGWLFSEKGVHRIEEIVDVENKASIYGLERLGFRREAHLIENIWFNEKWGSEYIYALLKREWDARQG